MTEAWLDGSDLRYARQAGSNPWFQGTMTETLRSDDEGRTWQVIHETVLPPPHKARATLEGYDRMPFAEARAWLLKDMGLT